MSEVTPVVAAQHGAFFLVEHEGGRAAPRASAAHRRLRLPAAAAASRTGSASARGSSARRASRASRSASPTSPRTTSRSASGLGEATPATILVMPIMFEEQVLGVIELGSLRPLRRGQPGVPRPARPTRSASCINTIQANMRTEELLSQSQALTQELQKQSEELRQTNDELQDKAILLSQQNRDIEIKNARDRARPPRPRGEGRAARALLEVQVRVPGEHEPRAAHAAQQPADPVADAGREPGRQPRRPAGRVRPDDPRGRQRPARADQRHPRPVEGRGGQDGPPPRPARARRPVRRPRARLPPARRGEGPALHDRPRPDAAGGDRHRRAAPRADPAQPALERVKFTHEGVGATLRDPRRARGGRQSSRSPSPTPASASPTRSSR